MILSFTIAEPMVLRDYLKQCHISNQLLADIKNHGDLLVNHEHVTVRYQLLPGDVLEIVMPKEARGEQMIPEMMPLNILYEDDYLLIVDKPVNMPCIPDHNYHGHTLANGLLYYYDTIGLDSTIHLINRLDKDTSGIVMIAKYRYIHALFANVPIYKAYIAHVEGEVKEDIMIDKRIAREEKGVRRIISSEGKRAVTEVHVLFASKESSYVRCILHTGRTHQIRVHLSSIGHPLVHDTLYGAHEKGQYELRCQCVQFIHPITKENISIQV